jgi:hypothetical protein
MFLELFSIITSTVGHAVCAVVEAVRYKPEGRGIDSPMMSEFFVDVILKACNGIA